MQKYAIIVAGGKGRRMQINTPKQYVLLKGKPVLIHTIGRFITHDPSIQIVIVLSSEDIAYWKEEAGKYFPDNTFIIVEGGKERYHSVKNGLASIKDENGLVAVHDAVRPLVSEDTIRKCYNEAAKNGNAIPVVNISESLRLETEKGSLPVDRSQIRMVQTPQVFHIKPLKEAYKQEYESAFTDDASVFEKAGHSIYLVEGNVENIKITTPQDLVIAEALLEAT